MKEGHRAIPFGLAIVVLIGFIVTAPRVQADMEKPDWQAGDFWAYEFSGPGATGSGGQGRLRYDVVGPETVSVGGTSYSTYHTDVALNVTGAFPLDMPGDAWFRTSDLALVKMNFTVTVEVSPGQTLEGTITVTANPPLRADWPLTSGDTWSVSGTVTSITQFPGLEPFTIEQVITGSVAVGATETRTVGGEQFSTTPVTRTESNGNSTKSYWSEDAGNSVEERMYDSADEETGSMRMTSYSYSPPAGTGTDPLGNLLGLPWYLWLALVVVVAAAAVAAGIVARRRRRPGAGIPSVPIGPMPPSPPMEPGPPGGPPTGPP
jgi:hypothetical protein